MGLLGVDKRSLLVTKSNQHDGATGNRRHWLLVKGWIDCTHSVEKGLVDQKKKKKRKGAKEAKGGRGGQERGGQNEEGSIAALWLRIELVLSRRWGKPDGSGLYRQETGVKAQSNQQRSVEHFELNNKVIPLISMPTAL
jgi:hypothetical protein